MTANEIEAEIRKQIGGDYHGVKDVTIGGHTLSIRFDGPVEPRIHAARIMFQHRGV